MASNIRFLTLVLVVSLLVQHVQVERIRNQQRENWRQMCVYLDAQRAEAILPLALASAAPYVLAALVAGTGAVWCYTHGGKEAWIQFTGATLDGVAVTKQWVQEQIAQLHNIDTSPGGTDGPLPNSQYQFGGKIYQFYGISSTKNAFPGNNERAAVVYRAPYESPNNTGRHMLAFLIEVSAWGYYYYRMETYTLVGDAPAGFNPLDHPELYNDENLMTNCHAVAKEYPQMQLSHVYPPSAVAPSSYDPTKLIEVPVVAQLADGSLVDQAGRKLPPPPPGVVPDIINPPVLDPDLVGGAQVATPASDSPTYIDPSAPASDVVLPKGLSDQLGALGISGPITGIKDVAGTKVVTWTNAQGQAVATPVSSAVAAQISPLLPAAAVASGAGTSVDSGNPEVDPGNPHDTVLPDVPLFDTSMDWGEEEPWPWDDWIGMLPFLDVLQGSSIQKNDASSIISVNMNFIGSNRTMSYDFASWEWLIRSMGFIIYACACWYALQLALLKRD